MSPGRSGLISLSVSSSDSALSRPFAEELRVEPDLELLAGEGHGKRLRGLAHVRCLSGNVEAALREAQPQRCVLLREQPHTAHDLEQLVAAHAQLVLVGVGEQLLIVRKAALDKTRGQHDPVCREDHLVLERGDADRVRRARAGDPAELLERSRRHVCLERALELLRKGRLLDAEPVGVGGNHAELTTTGRDQNAGEVGPRLVARRRPRHAVDRVHEGLCGNAQHAGGRRLRQLRKVLRWQRAQVKARLPRGDLHVLLGAPILEREVVLRQRADDVEQKPAGHDGLTRRGGLGIDRDAEPELHVGRLQLGVVVLDPEQDARQRLDGTARGRGPHGDAEPGEERFTGNGELQVLPNWTCSCWGCPEVDKGSRSRFPTRLRPVDGSGGQC